MDLHFIQVFYVPFFSELACLPEWKEDVLHNIIDNFLRLRFPMLLVLNKADLPTSELNINR